jgi:hypothetical protein
MMWRLLNSSYSGSGPVADSCDMVTKVWFHTVHLISSIVRKCRSQWPRCLKRGSAPAHLLGLWFRIPPGA